MTFLYSLFSAVLRIYGRPRTEFRGVSRYQTFMTFLILKCLVTWAKIKGSEPKSTKLFGFLWRFQKFEAFLYVFEEIFIERPYTFNTDKARPLIIDAGANTGIAALFFKLEFPDAEIICFEPDPKAFEILTTNISNSGLKGVTLVPKALGKAKGEITFYQTSGTVASVGSGVIQRSESDIVIKVETTSLAEYFEGPVDFLKMDIEGAELMVLEESMAKLGQCKELVIECHHRPEIQDHLYKILKLLTMSGFTYRLSSQPPRHAFNTPMGQDILIQAKKRSP